MLVTDVNDALPGGSSLLRNEPVQARSSARLTGLLDAAASIIDEIGFERLTTAMVAERAGASIGTVYRYFPDRIAVVEALSARGVTRLLERVEKAADDTGTSDWRAALDLAITAQVELYRSEPGFRAIRFSETETADRLGDSEVRRSLADRLTSLLVDRFDLERTTELEFAIEIATEVSTSLVARAFLHDPQGDSRFIDESRVVMAASLERVVSV